MDSLSLVPKEGKVGKCNNRRGRTRMDTLGLISKDDSKTPGINRTGSSQRGRGVQVGLWLLGLWLLWHLTQAFQGCLSLAHVEILQHGTLEELVNPVAWPARDGRTSGSGAHPSLMLSTPVPHWDPPQAAPVCRALLLVQSTRLHPQLFAAGPWGAAAAQPAVALGSCVWVGSRCLLLSLFAVPVRCPRTNELGTP